MNFIIAGAFIIFIFIGLFLSLPSNEELDKGFDFDKRKEEE